MSDDPKFDDTSEEEVTYQSALTREQVEVILDDLLILDVASLDVELAHCTNRLVMGIAVSHKNCRSPIWEATLAAMQRKENSKNVDHLLVLALIAQTLRLRVYFGSECIFEMRSPKDTGA